MTELKLTKAEQSKHHILETALKLIKENGYHNTTMRLISKTAGCSLGLTYRYFESKESLVLAFYHRNLEQWDSLIKEIDYGKLSDNFMKAIKLKLEIIKGNKEALGALFASLIDPNSKISVFGEETKIIREKSVQIYNNIINNSSDINFSQNKIEKLSRLLYSLQLGIVLVYLVDKTEEEIIIGRSMELINDTFSLAVSLLDNPFSDLIIERIDLILKPLLDIEK